MIHKNLHFSGSTVILLFLSLLPFSCFMESNPVSGSSATIAVYTPDGSPANGATVKIVPIDYVPGNSLEKSSASMSTVFSATTNKNGQFNTTGLAEGTYNIMASLTGKDTLVSFSDSVYISEKYSSIESVTMSEGITYRGYASVQAKHDPRTVVVLVLGTLHYTNVNSDGIFTLPNMAAGTYPLKLTSTEQGYTATYANAVVSSAQVRPDTFDLIYTGIPCVENISFVWDSQRSTARISWAPVNYRSLQEYNVQIELTDPGAYDYGYSTYSASTRDTSIDLPVCSSSPFRIKVSVVTISGEIGEACEFAEMSSQPEFEPPASVFKYSIHNHTAAISEPTGGISDDFTISATISNPALSIASVNWNRIDDGYLYPWSLKDTSFSDTSVISSISDVAAFDFRCRGTQYIICDVQLRTPCGNILHSDTIAFTINNKADVNPARVTNGSMVRIDVKGQPIPENVSGNVFAGNFWVDTTEVTRSDYFSVTGDSIPLTLFFKSNGDWGAYDTLPQSPTPERLAVDNVTWYDAVLYCNARSKRDGYDTVYSYTGVTYEENDKLPYKKTAVDIRGFSRNTGKNGYRLPSKAEMLALIKTSETSPRGTLGDKPYDYFWLPENSNGQPHIVSIKKPLYDGVYDVIGNMEEWLDESYYLDGTEYRLLFGYSCLYGNPNLLTPGYGISEMFSAFYGFRCVRGDM